MDDCLFCKIGNGVIPSHKILETPEVMAFLDINPVNAGHCLIIPKTHSDDFFKAEREDLIALLDATTLLAPKIKEAVEAQGINIAINNGKAAGQIIFHTHIHIIPRFESDGFRHWSGKKKFTESDFATLAEKIRSNF